MLNCSNCLCSKPSSHFTNAMIVGKDRPICNNCRRRYFTMLTCSVCNGRKKGLHFTSLMINGAETAICHHCKTTGAAAMSNLKTLSESGNIIRKCLKCDGDFLTSNKFIRMCRSCKSSNDVEQDWFRNE